MCKSQFRAMAASTLLATGLNSVAVAAPDITVSYIPTASATVSSFAMSGDGRYIAYKYNYTGTNINDIRVLDVVSGAEVQANLTLSGSAPSAASCDLPAISKDGRYVSFVCRAATMGVSTSYGYAYFVYDRIANSTQQVPDLGNDAALPTYATALSADGRYLAFRTGYKNSTSNTKMYVRDLVNRTTVVTSAQSAAVSEGGSPLSMSDDGRYIIYAGNVSTTSSATDVFVYDTVTGITETQNLRANGVKNALGGRYPGASSDASIVTFFSSDPNLTSVPGPAGLNSVYVRDRASGVTELVNPGSGITGSWSRVSGNGRYVVYLANSTLRVFDRWTKVTRDIVAAGAHGFLYPRISDDGRYVIASATAYSNNGSTYVVADMGIAAGLVLSSNQLTLTEGGLAGTYSIVLTQPPTADVKVTLTPGNELSLARNELTFTSSNWNVPQIISVQALQDGIAQGTHSAAITHTTSSADVDYSVVRPVTVSVAIADGVTPTLVIPGESWTKTEMPLSGTAAEGATVLLTASNRSTGWMSSVSTVADAQGNWSYTLAGYTDGVIDLDAQADGLKSVVRTVTVTLAVTAPAPTYIDVTGNIRTTAASLSYNRSTGKYVGDFVLTNTGSITLNGPLQLQFDNLTAGITLTNAIGTHDGAPYISVPAGLEPDQSVTIPLVFDNPARGDIGYAAKIYSGTF